MSPLDPTPADDPLIEAVVLLLREALVRFDSQMDGSMFRTPGHRAWLEEERQHARDLLHELTVGPPVMPMPDPKPSEAAP